MCPILRPHRLWHTGLLCPPPSPGVRSNSCPKSWRFHPTVSSSVVPFSSHPQSFPASSSFPVSRLFASDGKSIGALASAPVLPMNIQSLFPLGLTGLILLSKGLSRIFSSASLKAPILQHSALFMMQRSHHPCMSTEETVALTTWAFVGKVMPLLSNTLPRFFIAFAPRSKCL